MKTWACVPKSVHRRLIQTCRETWNLLLIDAAISGIITKSCNLRALKGSTLVKFKQKEVVWHRPKWIHLAILDIKYRSCFVLNKPISKYLCKVCNLTNLANKVCPLKINNFSQTYFSLRPLSCTSLENIASFYRSSRQATAGRSSKDLRRCISRKTRKGQLNK